MPTNTADIPEEIGRLGQPTIAAYVAGLKSDFITAAGGAAHPLGSGTVGRLADAMEAEVIRGRAGDRTRSERLVILWRNLTEIVEQ